MQDKIEKFYELWLTRLDEFLRGYVYYEENGKEKLYTPRFVFSYYAKLIKRFLNDEIEDFEKIQILTGLRGVGKTTLLAQIYYLDKEPNLWRQYSFKKANYEKIYLDVSRLKNEKISLNEFFKFFEHIKNFHFESLNKKVLILLDEVHYDPDWGLFLKTIYDRSKAHRNILIVATGSSALKLKTNPDLTRRSCFQELYPLKFSEFLILKKEIFPPKNLSATLISRIFLSKSPREIFKELKNLLPQIRNFYLENKLDSRLENDFLTTGSLPFLIKLTNNKNLVYERTQGLIDSIIIRDILELESFKSEAISKIKDIIALIANSDIVNLENISQKIKLDYKTIRKILDLLLEAGLFLEIRSYGSQFTKVRKPSKFLFIAPSIRASVLMGIIPSEIKGKLLEDYFALVYKKDIAELAEKEKISPFWISYDSSQGGADFLLEFGNKVFIIELGFGDKKKTGRAQINNSLRLIKQLRNKIGIVFSEANLEMIEENIINIPLRALLLI